VKIEPFAARKPHQLSGGQRQRVALARALVKRPKVFLLDEPLAALDKKLRAETQFELKELQRRLGVTFVIVTHDQEEAMSMADRIAVMDRGRLIQVASPAEIYEHPNSRWIAQFIGEVNLLDGRAAGGAIDTVAGRLRIGQAHGVSEGGALCIAIRPEKVRIARQQPAMPEPNCVAGKVIDCAYLGDTSLYKVALDNGFVMKAVQANVVRRADGAPAPGERVWLCFDADACVVLTQ
jgi:putrescine transport system ATP-binding protein